MIEAKEWLRTHGGFDEHEDPELKSKEGEWEGIGGSWHGWSVEKALLIAYLEGYRDAYEGISGNISDKIERTYKEINDLKGSSK